MDIKEKFHANLDLIREQKEQLSEAILKSYDDFVKSRVGMDSDSETLKDMIKKNNKRRGPGSKIMNRKYKEELSRREQKKQLGEAKDEREYGYEGDMAITQLKTICRNAENLMKMMKPDTDLPEWVQSKITKAEDYISTAHDYLKSEMNEEVESLDEVTRKYAMDKARKAEKKAYDYEDEGKRKSNMANTFGRKPEDSDRYDRESAEAYKKSSKKQKQNWKFREYAAKKK